MFTISAATLLEIAIPIKFDNDSRAITAKKSDKKCDACSEFLFCWLNLPLFHLLISIAAVVALSSPVAFSCKTILDMWQFCLENQQLMMENAQ